MAHDPHTTTTATIRTDNCHFRHFVSLTARLYDIPCHQKFDKNSGQRLWENSIIDTQLDIMVISMRENVPVHSTVLNVFIHRETAALPRDQTHHCLDQFLMMSTMTTVKTGSNHLLSPRCPHSRQNMDFSALQMHWHELSAWTSASAKYTAFQQNLVYAMHLRYKTYCIQNFKK